MLVVWIPAPGATSLGLYGKRALQKGEKEQFSQSFMTSVSLFNSCVSHARASDSGDSLTPFRTCTLIPENYAEPPPPHNTSPPQPHSIL